MENASLALKIAGGVLIAVIILSLVTWGFKQFGMLPEQQDASMTTEQLAKFNQEFEVYNKKKMYGVDVISCLNKVYNYNEKYVLEVGKNANGEGTVSSLAEKSDGFYSGSGKHGKEFLINAYVHLNTPLKERIEGYCIDERTGKEKSVFGKSIKDEITLGGNEGVWNRSDEQQLFKAYTKFGADTQLSSIDCGNEEILDDKSYYMTSEGGTSVPGFSPDDTNYYPLYSNNENGVRDNNPLYQLLKYSDTNMKKIASNRNSGGVTDWSKIIWYTALYDFKTRTFECTHMEIDNDTKRIKSIAFSEVYKK